MSDEEPIESPGPGMADDANAAAAAPRWSVWRFLGRFSRRTLKFAAILLAVAFVCTLAVDLGPGVRGVTRSGVGQGSGAAAGSPYP